MSLTPEQVAKIAELARLELSAAEQPRLTTQLSNILDYVTRLNELKIDGIEPTAHAVEVPTPFREDEVRPSGNREEILDGAPDREGEFFRVPKVL